MKLQELYGDKIMGAISGFDRVRFRGTMRWLAYEQGLLRFMNASGRLLKDFGAWVEGMTDIIKADCRDQADALGVPYRYLPSAAVDKEELAREIMAKRPAAEGSICMFGTVEPCISPQVIRDPRIRKLTLRMLPRKCLHFYHYFDDPVVGFGSVRVQTWLPFSVNVCLNGRHWLEKQLRREGIAYAKDANCFPWIADIPAAQRLLTEQLKTRWDLLLDELLDRTCPALRTLMLPHEPEYYWSADQTEYATDYMFRDPAQLAAIYPQLIRHAMATSDSPCVLRYFGKRNVTPHGKFLGKLPRELSSDVRRFADGLRIKHFYNGNSVKAYDKSGSVLRVETTINNARAFKVIEPPASAGAPTKARLLAKGVKDLHARCEISLGCNDRYAEHLASAQISTTLKQAASEACNVVNKEGKRYRGLNPWRTDDFQVLSFLANAQWALNGFRNRDLCEHLYGTAAVDDSRENRRRSGRVSRLLKLLRAHGLIRKQPRSRRYRLTASGRTFTAALLTASATDIQQLTKLAS